jgi:hypothetical protein
MRAISAGLTPWTLASFWMPSGLARMAAICASVSFAYSAALGAGDLGDAHLVAGAGVGPGARGLQVLARAAAHGVGFGHAMRIAAGGRPVPRIGGAGLLGQRAGVAAQGGKQAAHALANAGVTDRGARDFLALRPRRLAR